MEKERKKISGKSIERNNRLKTIVLDTNVLIDNVHGYAEWVDILLKKRTEYLFVVPTIVIAEYLTAKENETSGGKEKSKNYLGLFKTQDFTSEIAAILGEILRRKSYTPNASLADLIVAATAIYLDTPLATRNQAHFAKIPKLTFFDSKKIAI